LEVFRLSNQRPPGAGEPLRPKRKKRKRRWIGYTLLVLLGIMLGMAGVAGSFVYKAYKSLPAFEDFDYSLTSMIYDNKDQVVYKLAAEENRTLIKDVTEIPKDVLWAFIDTEDHRFYEHHGVDFYRLGGSVVSTLKYMLKVKGGQLEGGSTITMQLAGNAFLNRQDISMTRKVQEMMIAFQLEKRFTKDEILLRYLNQVSFGGQTAGLEAAAHTYFSKSAKDLTVSEAALLAGMLKGPSLYNPKTNMEGALNRRKVVLDLMAENGHLDRATADALKAEPVALHQEEITPETLTFPGDWYVDYVLEILTKPELAAKYGTPVFDDLDLYTKGLKIYTALDQTYQKNAEEKLQKIIPERVKYYGGKDIPEGASVMIDPRDGSVKALVGGLKHEAMRGFNRATDSYRDPGSSIKPLVAYLPAIDLLGWGPSTVIDDSPLMLNNDKDNVWPDNYDHKYNGLVSMRFGLEQSLNAVAVRTLQAVTPRKGIEYARLLGISSLQDASMDPKWNDEHLGLTLGGLTRGASPLEMTAAYGVLANLGMKVDPVVITRIENKDGEVIFEANKHAKQVVRKESTWLMVDVMKGSIRRGTSSYESKGWHGWPAAGKTGTTEEWHDAWFIGFTPELVTGVWTGFDNDNGEKKRLPANGNGAWTGAGPPTRIWTAIMDDVYQGKPPADWQRPTGLVSVEVCKVTGLLPSPLCPQDQLTTDWFRKGFEPKPESVLQLAKVVKQPWEIPGSNPVKTIDRYFLWQDGCAGTPEDKVMIKRPTTYQLHPTKPYDFDHYWPADWINEVPKEQCKVTQPPTTQPGQPGTPLPGQPGTPQPGQPGTPQPGDPVTPPPTQPGDPGTQPPGTGNPGTGIVLPPVLPPGSGH
jgi:penicillin-binding protein 1A